jgi:hypothetical protein
MKSVLIFIIFLSGITTTITGNEPVAFEDSELKEVITKILGVPNPTQTDMLALTELNTNGIKDLGGLEYAKNLKTLRIDNSISGFYKRGDRSDKRIEDISSLSSLNELICLQLSYNHINDISPLKSLKNLKELDLRNNRIKDISALSELTNLETLYITDNDSLNDISALSVLSNLRQLDLGWNGIRDINSLSMLTELEVLYLNSNNISDISALSDLKQLKILSVFRNQIQDITPLKELKNLSDLNLQFNNISDGSVLSSLPNLERVDFRNNPYYLKRFISISIISIAAIIIIGFLLQIYLNKYNSERKKLCMRTKLSILCCFLAPLTIWFSVFQLKYLLLGDTMIAENNLFVLGPMFVLLITGFISAVSVVVAGKSQQNCINSRNTTIVVLIFLIIVSFLCFYGALGFLLRNA